MKKCPYCAEKIQNEAIVCRYCGRDLRMPIQSIKGNPKAPIKHTRIPSNPKRSIWATGAIWSAIFTVLGTIYAVFSYRGLDLIFSLTVDVVVNFLGWWLICTFITWLWRKAGDNGGRKALIIIVVVIIFIILAIVFDILRYSIETPQEQYITLFPTAQSESGQSESGLFPTVNLIPTSTNEFADCKFWGLIDSSYLGKDICIYGGVRQIYQWQGYRRINFSRSQDYIYILYPNAQQAGNWPPIVRLLNNVNEIEIDSCLMFKGDIRMDNTGLLYIKTSFATACDINSLEP